MRNNNNRRRNNRRRPRRRLRRRRNSFQVGRVNYGGNNFGYNLTYNIGIPDSTYVKLKYNEILSRLPANIIDSYVYRWNSLYDPNYTGVGGQPTGFDQWATLYNNYEVVASSIKVTVFNNLAGGSMVICVYPNKNSTALTYSDAIDQAYAKHAAVGPATGVNTKTFRSHISAPKLSGRETYDLTYTANVGGNPTVQLYWLLSAFSVDATTNLDYSMEVEITFWSKFFDRLPLADV
jgi:hypothetical protein